MSSYRSLSRGDINLSNDPKRRKANPKSSRPTAGKSKGSPAKPKPDKNRSRTPGSSGKAKAVSPSPKANKRKSPSPAAINRQGKPLKGNTEKSATSATRSKTNPKPSSSRGSTPDKRSAKSNDSSRKTAGRSEGSGKGGKENKTSPKPTAQTGDQKQNKKPSTPRPAGILKKTNANGKTDNQQANTKDIKSKGDAIKSKVMSNKIMPFKKADKNREKTDQPTNKSTSKTIGTSRSSTPKPTQPERPHIKTKSEIRGESKKDVTKSRTSGSHPKTTFEVGRERFSDWKHSCHNCDCHPSSPIIKETLDYGSNYEWHPITFHTQPRPQPKSCGFTKPHNGSSCLHPLPIPGYAIHMPTLATAPRTKRNVHCHRHPPPIPRPCYQPRGDSCSQQVCSPKNGLYVVPCNNPRCLWNPNCGPLLVHANASSFTEPLNTTYIPPMPRYFDNFNPRGNSVDFLNARLQYSEQILRELQREL